MESSHFYNVILPKALFIRSVKILQAKRFFFASWMYVFERQNFERKKYADNFLHSKLRSNKQKYARRMKFFTSRVKTTDCNKFNVLKHRQTEKYLVMFI